MLCRDREIVVWFVCLLVCFCSWYESVLMCKCFCLFDFCVFGLVISILCFVYVLILFVNSCFQMCVYVLFYLFVCLFVCLNFCVTFLRCCSGFEVPTYVDATHMASFVEIENYLKMERQVICLFVFLFNTGYLFVCVFAWHRLSVCLCVCLTQAIWVFFVCLFEASALSVCVFVWHRLSVC